MKTALCKLSSGHSEAIVWEADRRLRRFYSISESVQSVLGHATERWLGEDDFWSRHVHEGDRSRVLKHSNALRGVNAPEVQTYRFMAADGRHRVICDVRMRSGADRVSGQFVSICIPGLHHGCNDTIALFEHAPVAIVEVDTSGRLRQANRRALEYTGYSASELAALESVVDLVAPEDRDRVRINMARLFRGENVSASEYTAYRKNGSTIPVEVRSQLILKDGQPDGLRVVISDLTEIKAAQQARLESTQKAQTLLQENEHAVLMISDGRISYANPAMERLVDCVQKEALGRPLLDFIHPEDRPQVQLGFDSVMRGLAPFHERCRMQDTGRRVIPVEIRAKRIIHDSAPTIMVTINDLSELQSKEAALAASQKLYQSVVELCPDPIVILQDEKVCFINSAFCALFGYTQEDARHGISYLDLICPAEREIVRDRYARRMKSEALPPHYRANLVAKDGTLIPCESALTQIEYRGSTALLIILRDLTPRLEAESELHRSQEQLEATLNALPDLMFEIDEDGLLLSYRAPDPSHLYATPEQFLGQKIDTILPADAAGIVMEALRQAGVHGRHSGSIYSLQIGERKRWYELSISQQPRAEGQRQKFIALARDVTLREEALQRLQQHEEHLEKLVAERTVRIRELERQRLEGEELAATGYMAARIAHEINNPLAAIQNAFLLVSRAFPKDHPDQEMIGLINSEIERIAKIVRHMFDLYSPSQSISEELDVEQLISGVIALLEPLARKSEVTLIPCRPSVPTLLGIKSYLTQILYNLIINAIQASPPGGTVEVTCETTGDQSVIAVLDEGHGIPDDLRHRIFHPFYTTRTESHSGTGLGLTVSRSYAEAMGGTLTSRARDGAGTAFELRLPRRRPISEKRE